MKALTLTHFLFVIVAVFAVSDCIAQEVIWERDGLEEGDQFGWSVALARSIDGDALADVLAGSGRHDDENGVAGHVAVLAGRDGSHLRDFFGSELGIGLGVHQRGVEDLDGDGCPDLLLSANSADTPNDTNSGRVWLYSGRTLTAIGTLDGQFRQDAFGSWTAILPDMDGDGTVEVVVAAPGHDGLSFSVGKVYIYSGATRQLLRWHTGEGSDDNLGTAVAAGGDLNGDGCADYVVSAHLSFVRDQLKGRIYAYSGADGSLLRTWTGTTNLQGLGAHLDFLSDIDGDGCDEILATDSGSPVQAYVYSGATGALLRTHVGPGLGFGGPIVNVGDWTGDGFEDYVISAFATALNGEARVGVVQLFSGRTGSLLYEFRGSYRRQFFGYSVDGGKDVDGDGIGDLVVGSIFGRNQPPNRGQATVFAGNDLFLQAEAETLAPGDTLTAHLRGGAAGGLGLLVLTAVDGLPKFAPVTFLSLDSNGDATFQATIPFTLGGGHTFALQGFAPAHPLPGARSRKLLDTSPVHLTIQ